MQSASRGLGDSDHARIQGPTCEDDQHLYVREARQANRVDEPVVHCHAALTEAYSKKTRPSLLRVALVLSEFAVQSWDELFSPAIAFRCPLGASVCCPQYWSWVGAARAFGSRCRSHRQPLGV